MKYTTNDMIFANPKLIAGALAVAGPFATAFFPVNGSFNFTITNIVSPSVQQQYYILQSQ